MATRSHGQRSATNSDWTDRLFQAGKHDREQFGATLLEMAPRLIWRLGQDPDTAGIVKNRSDVYDALQDAYLNAWRYRHLFDPKLGSAMTWLWSITRHAAIDILRRKRPVLELPNVAEGARSPWRTRKPRRPTTDEAREMIRRHRRQLRPALLAIRDLRKRRACILRFLKQWNRKEIMAHLQVPYATLNNWLAYGKRIMLRHLQEWP